MTAAPLPRPPWCRIVLRRLRAVFDADTMHLHHDKHHQAYVNNRNAAVAGHPEVFGKTVNDLVANLTRCRSPSPPRPARMPTTPSGGRCWAKGSAAPNGELAKAIDAKFGTFSAFQEQLTKAARAVFGSGWAWLVILLDALSPLKPRRIRTARWRWLSAGGGRRCMGACVLPGSTTMFGRIM